MTNLDEMDSAINFIKYYDTDDDIRATKEKFLTRQIQLLNKRENEEFSQEDLQVSFSIYSLSRNAYESILKYIVFPCVRTLRRITNKVDSLPDEQFLDGVTANLSEVQKQCFMLIDEIYVLPGYQYSGSVVHGKAEDWPDEKARTILALMLNFLFGGSKLVFKLHPVHTLDSIFLRERIDSALNKLHDNGIKVK